MSAVHAPGLAASCIARAPRIWMGENSRAIRLYLSLMENHMNNLRAIFVLGLVLALQSSAFAQEGKAPPEQPGMEKIFNGKDLSNWDGDPRLWLVKDGAIRAESV